MYKVGYSGPPHSGNGAHQERRNTFSHDDAYERAAGHLSEWRTFEMAAPRNGGPTPKIFGRSLAMSTQWEAAGCRRWYLSKERW